MYHAHPHPFWAIWGHGGDETHKNVEALAEHVFSL